MALTFWEGITDANSKIINSSDNFIYIYSQTSGLTIQDVGGNSVQQGSSPCWLPPGFVLVAGGTGLRFWGYQSQTIADFAGFLLSRPVVGRSGVLSVIYRNDGVQDAPTLTATWTHT